MLERIAPRWKTAALVLMAIVLGGWWWRHSLDAMPVAAIPTPRLPSPNAFDYYVRAGDSLVDRQELDAALSNYSSHRPGYSWPQKAAVINSNTNALGMLREGFRYPYQEPPARSFYRLCPHYMRFRNLARLLKLEGQVKAASGDASGAIASNLDALKLGNDIPHGAPLMGNLIAVACQAIGRQEAWERIDGLSAAQARQAARRLEAISLSRITFADTLSEEMWMGQASLLEILKKPNWRSALAGMGAGGPAPLAAIVWLRNYMRLLPVSRRKIFDNYTNYMTQLIADARQPYAARTGPPPTPNDPFNETLLPGLGRGKARFGDTINRTQNDLLLVTLALRAFRAEHGRYPASLSELVPSHLRSIPDDPFALTGKFCYRRTTGGCVLYSIGPDGKDNGGTPITYWSGRRVTSEDSLGDIVAGVNTN